MVSLVRRILTIVLFIALGSACAPRTAGSTPTPESKPVPSPKTAPVPTPTDLPTAVSSPTRVGIEWVDDLGREGVLQEPAERVISLAPSNTEILFAIGAGDVLVGRDEFSDFPAQALEVSSIGSVYGEINLEAIVALDPDLVLAAEINSPEHVDAIQALGIQVYYLANPDDFEGLFENITTLGRLTGRETLAQNLANQLEERVRKVLGSLEGRPSVRVYYEIDGVDDPTAPWTTGSGTFQHHLITMAGGENIAADLEGWKKINVEEIISRDPEVIIYEEAPWIPTTAESIADREGWGGIKAVIEGSIYGIDTQWTGRPGPRYVDAFEAMAEMLHPEAFE